MDGTAGCISDGCVGGDFECARGCVVHGDNRSGIAGDSSVSRAGLLIYGIGDDGCCQGFVGECLCTCEGDVS